MNSFYLGCDVSKGYADFVIIDAKKNIVEPNFQLDDTFDGHNRLYDILNDFFKEYPQSTLYAAVESTGGLENNWLNFREWQIVLDTKKHEKLTTDIYCPLIFIGSRQIYSLTSHQGSM